MPFVPTLKKKPLPTIHNSFLPKLGDQGADNQFYIDSFIIESKNDFSEFMSVEEPSEQMNLKDVIKKLYEALFDKMALSNRSKRPVLQTNYASNNENGKVNIDKPQQQQARRGSRNKNNSVIYTNKKCLLEESTLNSDAGKQNESKLNIMNNFDSSTKIDLSLDREIFDVEKLRQTPKLIALQKRSRTNSQSIKDQIHSILDMYTEANLYRSAKQGSFTETGFELSNSVTETLNNIETI